MSIKTATHIALLLAGLLVGLHANARPDVLFRTCGACDDGELSRTALTWAGTAIRTDNPSHENETFVAIFIDFRSREAHYFEIEGKWIIQWQPQLRTNLYIPKLSIVKKETPEDIVRLAEELFGMFHGDDVSSLFNFNLFPQLMADVITDYVAQIHDEALIYSECPECWRSAYSMLELSHAESYIFDELFRLWHISHRGSNTWDGYAAAFQAKVSDILGSTVSVVALDFIDAPVIEIRFPDGTSTQVIIDRLKLKPQEPNGEAGGRILGYATESGASIPAPTDPQEQLAGRREFGSLPEMNAYRDYIDLYYPINWDTSICSMRNAISCVSGGQVCWVETMQVCR